jgi:hypothetical protein
MKTHEFDVLSFLTGLLITAIGLAFLLLPDLNDIIDVLTDAGSWFWPAVFIAVGVAVLAPLATRGRSTKAEDDPDETRILSD